MFVLQMQNLTAKDFYKKCKYNFETCNQLWCSQLADSHDIWCNCDQPFAHLLSSLFPPGHADRELTINQILLRDYKERCHFGGEEERSGGGAAAATPGASKGQKEGGEEEDFPGDEVEEFLAAASREDIR